VKVAGVPEIISRLVLQQEAGVAEYGCLHFIFRLESL